ncbi:MAG: tetratricopeptide repeat protein [Blautia sp.]|nr:tetratricopeptide repeat protein [Blautia sp.]
MYSNNVFTEENRKGLTLVRFWTEILCYPWRTTAHGKRIWRTEGSKNRLHSELCNRKESFLYYEEYIEEIIQTSVIDTIRQQIDQFRSFLKKREYNPEALQRKIEVFLEKASQSDPCCTEPVHQFFRLGLHAYRGNAFGQADVDAWLLTMLTLHAIAGNSMNSSSMQALREREDLRPEAVFSDREPEIEGEGMHTVLLTNRNSELCQTPLREDRFFGREKELFELQEMLSHGGHYLISGMGGTGKTELVRQHLGRIRRDPVARRIAAVQFEGNLVDSFTRSFPDLGGNSAAERFMECLYILSEKKDTVLYIDNLDTEKLAEEEISRLAELPCTIFATSRQTSLRGFLTCPVPLLDDTSSALVFRSNYGFALSEEDKRTLGDLLSGNHMNHPLILRLLGASAREHRWSIKETADQFAQNQWGLFRKKSSREAGLRTVLCGLYDDAGLTGPELQIVHLLAILPYQSYPADRIREYMGMEEAGPFRQALGHLRDTGWVEEHEDACSIHPVIAESILARSLTEQEFAPFWKKGEELFDWFHAEKAGTIELVEEAYLVFSAASRIRGRISGKLAHTCCMACYILLQYRFEGQQALRQLESILGRSTTKNAETEALHLLIRTSLAITTDSDEEKIRQILKKQNGLSSRIYWELYLGMVSLYSVRGMHKEVVQLADEGLLRKDIPAPLEKKQKIYLYLYKGTACIFLSKRNECEEALRKVISEAGASVEPYGDAVLMAFAKLAWLYIEQQEPEKAKEYYQKAQELLPEYGQLEDKAQLLNTGGYLAELEGDLETALALYSEMSEIYEKIGGQNNASYRKTCALLARVYSRMGRSQEAYRLFDSCIAYERKSSPKGSYLMMLLNNAAVACLEGGDPEKAYPLLLEARELAPAVGEVAMAETGFNLARVFRARGAFFEEKKLLEECVPVFERNYGPEHTKTIRAAKRLEELQKM